MLESGYKVHLFLAAICSGWVCEQPVCIRESGAQQRDQIVFEHGLQLGILLVLPITGLEHQPGVLLRNIFGQREPVAEAIIRQLYGVLLVGLGPP